ncbi:MAG: hypothetical protein HY554_11100 [Elusimicrobia bacterium]|nr:hypothetical protein [Elusimicrobiota bacterium]
MKRTIEAARRYCLGIAIGICTAAPSTSAWSAGPAAGPGEETRERAMAPLRQLTEAAAGYAAPDIPAPEPMEAVRLSSCAAAIGILGLLESLPAIPPSRIAPQLDWYAYPYDTFDSRALARNAAAIRRHVESACGAGLKPDSRLLPLILRDTQAYGKNLSVPSPDTRAVPKTAVNGLVRAAQALFHPTYGD